MYVEAWAVKDRWLGQEAAGCGQVEQQADEDDEAFAVLFNAFAAEAPFKTISVRDREYVVFASPYSI